MIGWDIQKKLNNKELKELFYVQFVLTSDETIKNVNIVSNTNELLGPEELRLVNFMPYWTPGENKGKSGRSIYIAY